MLQKTNEQRSRQKKKQQERKGTSMDCFFYNQVQSTIIQNYKVICPHESGATAEINQICALAAYLFSSSSIYSQYICLIWSKL